MLAANIQVRTLVGKEIQSHLPAIVKLRIEILREYPTLHLRESQGERRYLKNYIQSEEAVAVIILDHSTLVGVGTGIPLRCEKKEIQRLFTRRGWDPSSIFYFEEALLLPDYRSRGIGHHFFDLREKHALQQKKYQRLCFLAIDRGSAHPKKPEDYLSPEQLWIKRGFRPHPEHPCALSWRDVGEPNPSQKRIILWSKPTLLTTSSHATAIKTPRETRDRGRS